MNATLLDQLRESLARLAAPADVQIQFLKEFGTFPNADELALLYHDFAVTAPTLHGEGKISAEVLTEIRALDAKLTAFSGAQYELEWQAESLDRSQHWAEVRSLANKILQDL